MGHDEDILAVLNLLSAESLRVLSTQSEQAIGSTAAMVGGILSYLEEQHVVLDPVQREVVIDAVVVTITGILTPFEQILGQLVDALRSAGGQLPDGPALHDLEGN